MNEDISFDIVIHTQYGGFSLTKEIVDRLRKRKCPWISELVCASPSGPWYIQDEKLRRDEHLIAVVRELQAEMKDRMSHLGTWRERAALEQELLHGLAVVTVQVEVEIEEDDGKERVRVLGWAS